MTDYVEKIAELKKDRKLAKSWARSDDLAQTAITLAETILADLAAIQGAGDAEVEEAIQECYACFGEIGRVLKSSRHLSKLEKIAISRGQQRDEALARVAELEEENALLRGEIDPKKTPGTILVASSAKEPPNERG